MMWNYIIKNIFLVSLKDERKITELKIAAFIGEHCSINAVRGGLSVLFLVHCTTKNLGGWVGVWSWLSRLKLKV